MKRLFNGLLSCLLLSTSVAFASDDKKPKLTAEEIISRHIEAAGGRERLARFKSRIAVGTVKKENDPEGKMAIVSESPNRMAAVFLFPNYDLRFIFNGSKAALRPQIPRQLAPFDAKYREMAESGLMFNSISLYNLLLFPPEGVKFEAKGTKKLKGQEAYVVEVKRPKTDTMRLYFAADTFMWVRTDYGKAHVSGEMRGFTNESVGHGAEELTVDFYIETSDFREVGGVKLPFKFQMLVTTPILRQSSSGPIVGTINEYRHDEPINPDMFQ